ncbi:hypothetical protein ACFFJY_17635 [Fictibacillus aquaticus]|uniref:Uncharacterized protein n=1 Tax=Fictibacillus aquaticus TaxID=2021314 RepID=A0A235F5X8_9BACL|nr:hypothetical protein [Fictibacillus aquaticus]OYD56632.1 hypothetical protein CGZ90_16615 [Fictibacillus aquaticus]
MTKDLVFLTLFIIVVVYNIVKNRNLLKELTILQLLGTGVSYLAAIMLAFVSIYYGGNWISGFVSNRFLEVTVQFVTICFTLMFCGYILPFLLKKMTNGVLPKS